MHLTLAVDGVHCAGCIRKIEGALVQNGDVRQARLNFSTRRLLLSWQGDAARADDFGRLIEDLGFRVQPFEPARVADEARSEERFLLLCLAVAGFAAGNIMLLSFALWSTTAAEMGEATRTLLHWISALIALPTVAFSARPFFRSAFAVLRRGRTNMDVPISVGVLLTCGISLFETVRHGEHAYFDSVVMLVFFLLVGRYLDQRARRQARAAASDLLGLMAATATVLQPDGAARLVPVSALEPGMVAQVALGERVPADGILLDGPATLDASLITGETLPQVVATGGALCSGMLNTGAPLRLEVSRPAENSLLADIVRLMEKAEQGQARYVRLADRAARLYTPVVHILALLSFLGWTLIGGMAFAPALLIAATVLIITCPCALGLAVPVVQVLATGLLMRRGVMVKAGDALERLAAVDVLVFDKTGTLTVGQPELLNAGEVPALVLRRAAGLALHSRHPLAQALVRICPDHENVAGVTEHPGEGLSSGDMRLGSRRFVGVDGAGDGQPEMEMWFSAPGATPVRLVFADRLRADAPAVLAALRAMGMDLWLLSGDRSQVVAEVAGSLPFSRAEGGMKPADKVAAIRELQARPCRVGMVGDGLNDAPVLAAADVSLSPASAMSITQNAADIVFTGDRLESVVLACRVARRARGLVRDNFVLAVVYNLVAIPLAMAGLVTPLLAAVAMSGSSLLVIANSFRLRRGLT